MGSAALNAVSIIHMLSGDYGRLCGTWCIDTVTYCRDYTVYCFHIAPTKSNLIFSIL